MSTQPWWLEIALSKGKTKASRRIGEFTKLLMDNARDVSQKYYDDQEYDDQGEKINFGDRKRIPFIEQLENTKLDAGPLGWGYKFAFDNLVSDSQKNKAKRGLIGYDRSAQEIAQAAIRDYIDENDLKISDTLYGEHKKAIGDIAGNAYGILPQYVRSQTVDARPGSTYTGNPMDIPVEPTTYMGGKWIRDALLNEKLPDGSSKYKFEYFKALGEGKLLPSSYFNTDGSATSEGIDWIERTNEKRAGWNKTQNYKNYEPLEFNN